MRIFNKIIDSNKEPSNYNDIWFDGTSFKIYKEGEWQAITSYNGEGGTGLQYAVERTVYIGQMFIDGECIGTGELSDEERAYNVETYRMAAIDFEPVFLSFDGYFLPLLYTAHNASKPNEGQAKFGIVVSLDPSVLDSISVTITGGGDAIARAEGIETGSSVPSDMNSDFSNDF